MIHGKFQSILPKNGQENRTETWFLAKKMHNGENAFVSHLNKMSRMS